MPLSAREARRGMWVNGVDCVETPAEYKRRHAAKDVADEPAAEESPEDVIDDSQPTKMEEAACQPKPGFLRRLWNAAKK